MSGVRVSQDTQCRSLGFVNNPPRGYFRTVKTCYPGGKEAKVPLKATVKLANPFASPERHRHEDSVVFDTIESDTTGMYNTDTGEFTISRNGCYEINATLCSRDFEELPTTSPLESPPLRFDALNYGVVIALNGQFESKHNRVVQIPTPSNMPFIQFESIAISRKLTLQVGDVVTIHVFLFAVGLDLDASPVVPLLSFGTTKVLSEAELGVVGTFASVCCLD